MKTCFIQITVLIPQEKKKKEHSGAPGETTGTKEAHERKTISEINETNSVSFFFFSFFFSEAIKCSFFHFTKRRCVHGQFVGSSVAPFVLVSE